VPRGGFTLIELLVVLAIVAVLAAVVVPRYFSAVPRAEEAVLAENLRTLREAIDKYYVDRGLYPSDLSDLVERRYLRTVPIDPITRHSDWKTIPPEDPKKGTVFDVHSAALGTARDGRPYSQW
jgi:general secretion pathway protein G